MGAGGRKTINMSKKLLQFEKLMPHLTGKRVDFYTSTVSPNQVSLTGKVVRLAEGMIHIVDVVNMHGEEDIPQQILVTRIHKVNIATIQDNWRALITAKTENK